MNLRDRAVLLLATGFGVGHIPLAPGTYGSLLGLPLCFVLAEIGFALIAVVTTVGLVFFSVWIASQAQRLIRTKDAPCIVIDEMAGMAVAMLGLPLTVLNLALGFIVFRLLDIIKPFPARHLDANVSGGWGIVMDDVVAGLYCNMLLRAIALLFGSEI
jgi:phosphatidylglycerophosphatase A